ncbi:TPA: flippase [Streptococcus suis]
MKKSLKYNFVMNLLLSITNFLFPLITFPYLSRVLLATGIGRFAFVQSIINYTISFAMLGIPLYGVKACAEVIDKPDELSKRVRELMRLNAVVGLVALLVLMILVGLNTKLYEHRYELVALSFLVPLTILGAEWYFKAKEDFSYITKRTLVVRSLSLGLLFFFVRKPSDLILYLLIFVFTSGGPYLINYYRLRKELQPNREKLNLVQHLPHLLSYFFISMGWMLYSNTDIILLGYLSTEEQIGYYSASLRIKSIVVMVITTLTQTMLPRVIQYFNKDDRQAAFALLQKAFSYIVFLSLYFIGFVVIQARDLLDFFSGADFIQASQTLQITILATLAVGFSGLLNNSMIAQSKEKIVHRSILFGLIVNILINSLLIPRYGSLGSAWAGLIGEMVMILVLLIAMKADGIAIIDVKNTMKIVFSSVCSLLFLVFLNQIVDIQSIFFSLLLSGSLYTALYFLINWLQNEQISRYSSSQFYRIISKFRK